MSDSNAVNNLITAYYNIKSASRETDVLLRNIYLKTSVFRDEFYTIIDVITLAAYEMMTLFWVVCWLFFCGGAYQHCSNEGLLYSNPPNGVPSFISRGAPHQAA
jgi:hypothetical protein